MDPAPEMNTAVSMASTFNEIILTEGALESAALRQQESYRSLLRTPFLFLQHTFERNAFEGA